MDVGAVAIQFLHVAAGAAWFGGSLFANAVVLPLIARQAPERQRELIGGLVLGPERVMVAAALGAAVTGLVRGTVYGRIDSLGAVASPYGLVWLTATTIPCGSRRRRSVHAQPMRCPASGSASPLSSRASP